MFVDIDDLSGPANSLRLGVSWEPWLTRIIYKFKHQNNCALDIGAHLGIHTVELSKHFKKVYAFEPNPIVYQNLRMNTCDKKKHNYTQIKQLEM